MASKSIATALKNNYDSQMKITYKGNTYQELLDITGDKGKTSFEDPASETEYLRRIHWGRFGNISLTKYVNVYKINEVDGKKTKTWDDKESYWAK